MNGFDNKFKSKTVSEPKEIAFINSIISNAIIHGADSGGSYNQNEEGLLDSVNAWLRFKNLDKLYHLKKAIVWHGNADWYIPQIVRCANTPDAKIRDNQVNNVMITGQFWSSGDNIFIDVPGEAGVNIVCLNDKLIKDIPQNSMITVTIEVGNMTRDAMIAFIKTHPGVRITHELFASDEYICALDNGIVYDENGYLFEDWYSENARDGIRIRTGDRWETGWKFFK